MLTQLLNPTEARAYLRTLLAVSASDGITEEEMRFIDQRARIFGESVGDLIAEPTTDLEALRDHCSLQARRVIVRDCINLALVDGKYTDIERAHIARICEQLEVSPEVCKAIEAWTIEYWELVKRGNKLLRDSNAD